VISVLDYSKGFAHTELVTCQGAFSAALGQPRCPAAVVGK